jgi:hypothetical protein
MTDSLGQRGPRRQHDAIAPNGQRRARFGMRISVAAAQLTQTTHGIGPPLLQSRHFVQGVMTFTPAAAPDGGEFDHRVQRHFNGHALLHAGIAKVRHEALQNAHVTDDQRGHHLLLHINHDTGQTRHEVAITFAPGKSVSYHMDPVSHCMDTTFPPNNAHPYMKRTACYRDHVLIWQTRSDSSRESHPTPSRQSPPCPAD